MNVSPIYTAILEFYYSKLESGDPSFYPPDLRQFVTERMNKVEPNSTERRMRELRAKGLLDYEILPKSRLYKFLPLEEQPNVKEQLAEQGQFYECPVLNCGEVFPIAVWHCPFCTHHWPLERDYCANCHEPLMEEGRLGQQIRRYLTAKKLKPQELRDRPTLADIVTRSGFLLPNVI